MKYQILSIFILLSCSAYSQETILKREKPQEVDLKMDYIGAHEAGTQFQILGVGLIVGAFVLQEMNIKKATPTVQDIRIRQIEVKGLAIGGGAIFTLGTVMKASSFRKMVGKK